LKVEFTEKGENWAKSTGKSGELNLGVEKVPIGEIEEGLTAEADEENENVQRVLEHGFINKVEEVEEEEAEEKSEIDEKLVRYLESRGFGKTEGKDVWSKEVMADGEPKKLIVNFQEDERGRRYGYDLKTEKSEKKLRKHPDLLMFKRLRDGDIQLAEAVARAEKEEKEMQEKEIEEAGVRPTGIVGTGDQAQQLVQINESEVGKKIEEDLRKELAKDKILERYCYEVKGQIRLTWQGVWAVARRRGNFEVSEVKAWKDENGIWWGYANVKDKLKDINSPATVKQDPEDPRIPSKEFIARMAEQKALRNALRRLVPTAPVEAVIEVAKERRDRLDIALE